MGETEKTILVVDDQPANLQLLMTMLKRQGFKVYVADSGERALSILEKNPPELILLDVMMPGMNGYEACRAMKANPKTADIPVIFMTALDGAEDKDAAFDAGGVDYVTKPFQQVELFARVNAHISLKRLQAEMKTLRSLLPVCLRCGQRREEVEYWDQVDAFVQRQATSEPTDGYCSQCRPEVGNGVTEDAG